MNASCWICGSEYENAWHVCPLPTAIVSILRDHSKHISGEFQRCANSSAGSTEDPGFLRPVPRQSATTPSTPATDTTVSWLYKDDEWWTEQNRDTRYLAEMEDQLRQWEDDER